MAASMVCVVASLYLHMENDMHPVHSNKKQQTQPHPQSDHGQSVNVGMIRRWFDISIRKWQRRKMIAALNAMDPRLLRDLGIEPENIESVVEGFDARELRMVPLASSQDSVPFDRPMRTAV
jgi:uncharacterized protein YjiS (DUF1127 family)